MYRDVLISLMTKVHLTSKRNTLPSEMTRYQAGCARFKQHTKDGVYMITVSTWIHYKGSSNVVVYFYDTLIAVLTANGNLHIKDGFDEMTIIRTLRQFGEPSQRCRYDMAAHFHNNCVDNEAKCRFKVLIHFRYINSRNNILKLCHTNPKGNFIL
jgi:hypothetical protein